MLVSSNGVKVPRRSTNVMFPLLLTNSVSWICPKKLAVKPMLTAPVDPSSLAGKFWLSNPATTADAVAEVGRLATNAADSSPATILVVEILRRSFKAGENCNLIVKAP